MVTTSRTTKMKTPKIPWWIPVGFIVIALLIGAAMIVPGMLVTHVSSNVMHIEPLTIDIGSGYTATLYQEDDTDTGGCRVGLKSNSPSLNPFEKRYNEPCGTPGLFEALFGAVWYERVEKWYDIAQDFAGRLNIRTPIQ